jgi:hypothetical protein
VQSWHHILRVEVHVSSLCGYQNAVWKISHLPNTFNPLKAELNAICRLLALLGAHHIFHVSRARANASWYYSPIFDLLFKDVYHFFLFTQTILTFRHHASSIYYRSSATLQRMLFIYLINKYISLYFFETCWTISIYCSTKCRVFYNVTFFGS